MPHSSPCRRAVAAIVLLLCFLCTSAWATSEPGQWVRIHHRAELSALDSDDLRGRLSDYGSFQWGRLAQEQIDHLRARGLSITSERNPFELELGGSRFDPLETNPPAASRTADPQGDFYIVQFEGPVRAEWLRELRASGVEVVQPLHPFSYIVWARSAAVSAAAGLPSVRWSGLMRAEWKVPPGQRFSEPGVHPTMALASAHVNENGLLDELRSFGRVHSITRLNRHYRVVHLDVDRRDYSLIAEIPGIYTVQYIPPEAGPRGEMSQQSIVGAIDGSGDVLPGYASWLNDTGYDGSGITVGVVDGRVLTTHIDLADRIMPCDGTNGSCGGSGSDDHGTHVAGAIAGTGATGTLLNGFLRGQGVAPGANIVTQRYSPFLGAGPGSMVPDGMLDIYQDSAKSGVLLTNNSWGPTGSPQGYDIPTQQIDFISRDADPDVAGHQPVLAVWSVMNGNGDSGGTCAPSSLGSPDEAKNLFAVGSTALQSSGGDQLANIFRISANSGHGPACDGRRVPHIVAPGCSTDSTVNSSNTAHSASFCGTSMASPVVSGAVAVWAEKYIAETGVNPSPALVKAVFTAAAQNLEGNPNADGGTMGHRPDRFQGYGRVDLETVMNHGVEVFLHDQETVFDAVGQNWSLELNAVDPAQPIRIMLAWTDAPGHGLGGTTPAWVNDLDLSVDADGSTYLGNAIGLDGWSATTGTADGMNNLEGVFLGPAQHGGAVSITVTASDLAGDALNPYDPGDPSQDFALACYNCFDGDPTYTMETTPETLEACIPESGSSDFDVDVTLGTLGSYTGTVDLSASGEPSGVSSAFAPTSVVVPGSSVWTLSISDSATPGDMTVMVDGDDGTDQHSAELALVLDSYLGSAPTLLAPADDAADLGLAPTFEWNALPDIGEYRIQVSTDSGFGTTVIDEAVSATSFTPSSDLAIGTEYFWRVQGINLCDGGDWSPMRSFTTRLEPAADISDTQLTFNVPQSGSDGQTIQIGNVGTGNLTWSVATDTIDAGPGNSRFDGYFDIGNWELVNDPAGVNGSFDTQAGPPIELFVIGGADGTAGNTDFEIEVPTDGTIHFDWGYQSQDSGNWDSGGFAVNGAYTELADNASEVPYFDEPASVEVTQGDLFAFRVHTVDGVESEGNLGVTDFQFEASFCGDEPVSADWLSVSPESGSVAAGEAEDLTVTADTTGLAEGEHTAWLCVTTNDPDAEMITVEVNLTVTDFVGDEVFEDRFEDPGL